MPTATDLVTDLPADFEVFGQAVATSMADLLGGTTGQVLSKTTNADMDFTWINNDQGDITGVTAGTGISGGGTSGTVTVTNSMATAIDAKGDLIGGTGADAFARLAVGANGTILTADSAETTGMKWAAPSSSALPAFSAYATTNQSLSSGVWTKVTFGSEDFDTNTNFASSRFTPTVSGYYQINAAVQMGATSGGADQYLAFYKNGANYKTAGYMINNGTNAGSITLFLNGSTDYVEVYVNKTGTSPTTFDFSSVGTFFNGVGVRA